MIKDNLHRFERAEDSLCLLCGGEDSVKHVLSECAMTMQLRRNPFDPDNSVSDALQTEAKKIFDFLESVGRLKDNPTATTDNAALV